MKKRPWLKRVAIFLCMVMVICIFVVFKRVQEANEAERAQLRVIAREYDEVMRPLWEKKAQLEREITEQEQLVADEAPPVPVILLCTEPSEKILEDIYPITNQYMYPAAIVISEDAFPGEANRMFESDVSELCDEGWELCLGADADTDLAALYDRVTEAGLPAPIAVYTPNNDLTPVQETQALALGIHTAICYGKNAPESKTDGLWYVSAYGSNESDSKTTFQSKVLNAMPQALTVGYSSSREQFSESNYSNMIKTVSNYEKSDDVIVMSIQGANEAYLSSLNAFKPETEAERRLSELKAELEAVTDQIWGMEKK